MENIFNKVEELGVNVRKYVDTRIEEAKFDVAEKSSSIISNLIAGLTVAVLFLFFIVFGSIALAIGLGIWLCKMWLGFLIVACCYLLIALITWFGRKLLIQLPVMNSLIKQLFKNNEED